ncbi:hypothetical protein [Streptomyces showdoensis]|uniref:Alpha/beta hydrolase n=1 Tax=Streptomyces showdoensis TaxID=68268 RepID=A0A2P2GPJ3_STREW|nr:hypothetical protein [Streptomyces showdoensis]KKZ72825.1 hypothetical protein VO63_15890 [Streptomyces showdoensis]
MTSTTAAPWTGLVPIDDTALAVTDTGGPGQAVVYLNGSYADQKHWRRAIADTIRELAAAPAPAAA